MLTIEQDESQKTKMRLHNRYMAKKEAYSARRIAKSIENRQSNVEFGMRTLKEFVQPDTWCTNHKGCLRISAIQAESQAHRQMKFDLFCEYTDLGYSVFSEVRFKDGRGRADLVVVGNNGSVEIHEVAESEPERSLILKQNKYPFPVVVHRTNSHIKVGGLNE